jgi:methylated-DNA-[protein]-cysteine S-methyltransferase
MLIWDFHETSIGTLSILCSRDSVFAIHFEESSVFQKILKKHPFQKGENDISRDVKNQLDLYFKGSLSHFSLPLAMDGTDFQINVWKGLLKIVFGKTASYKDLSLMINMPLANRAIGNANGKNPFLIVVPCHRVILENGKLGGYSAGIDHKKWLLNFEKSASEKIS